MEGKLGSCIHPFGFKGEVKNCLMFAQLMRAKMPANDVHKTFLVKGAALIGNYDDFLFSMT